MEELDRSSRYDVLLVEGRVPFAAQVRRFFAAAAPRSRIGVARRLDEAVATLRRRRPDLVLLDLGVPDREPLTAVEEVIAQAPGLPIVVLADGYDEALAQQVIGRGAQDFVVKKDVDARRLLHVTRLAIARARQADAQLHIARLNRVYAVLKDVNQAIVREKDPDAMLAAACRSATGRDRFSMAWIGFADQPGGPVRIRRHSGAAPAALRSVNKLLDSRPVLCPFTARALRTGAHAVCHDIATDPEAAILRDAGSHRKYRTMTSLPLKSRERVIGTLNLYAGEPGFFGVDEMRLLDELAGDIAFALEIHDREAERRRGENALRDSEARLRASIAEVHGMATRLNVIREQERTRMAREIHDQLGQALTALKMDVGEVRRRLKSDDRAAVEERLTDMSSRIDASVEDVRRVATNLRPVILDDLGIIPAIRSHLEDVQSRAKIRCVLSTPLAELSMPGDRATALFRILQEALTNVVRHAGARRVDVSLTKDPRGVRLVVHDDGRGLPPAARRNKHALGLVGMRDRAALFGGDVTVTGNRREGTTVTADVPLSQEPG